MSINKYKLVAKFPQKELTTKNVIDLLYSVFSFKLINEYFINYTISVILDSITKKITNKEITKYNVTVKIIVETFFFDHLYWSIEESNYKENNNNLLLQKKIYNLKNLSDTVEKIIIYIHKSVNMKSSSKTVVKIKKEIFKRLDLKKIIPLLEKNHLPPLASNDAFKTHKIKEKKAKNIITDESGNDYYLYRENDIVSKIPFLYLTTGFQMKRFREENYVSVDLRQFIITKYSKLLKKHYTEKSNFNNAVFYLLTYYKLNGFLDNTGVIHGNIPKIKNKILEKLYNKSIELIGTPFSVPQGNEYFGLFPDIEQHFGSSGSFYDINPISGVYSINLPLSYGFIKNTLEKVNKWLGAVKKSNSLSFLLWVPLNIYNVPSNLGYDISTSILANVYSELLPQLKKSKYTKEKHYYLYDKKATENTASHIVFILKN